jgi:hypothetical protein
VCAIVAETWPGGVELGAQKASISPAMPDGACGCGLVITGDVVISFAAAEQEA